jgi:hypothetical protein
MRQMEAHISVERRTGGSRFVARVSGGTQLGCMCAWLGRARAYEGARQGWLARLVVGLLGPGDGPLVHHPR